MASPNPQISGKTNQAPSSKRQSYQDQSNNAAKATKPLPDVKPPAIIDLESIERILSRRNTKANYDDEPIDYKNLCLASLPRPLTYDDPESCSSNTQKLHQKRIAAALEDQCLLFNNCKPSEQIPKGLRAHSNKNDYDNLLESAKAIVEKSSSVPIECINASLIVGSELAKTNRVYCSNESSQTEPSSPICITPQLIQYIHVVFNAALRCINSDGKTAVNPFEFFKLINHESRFQPNIEYEGGIGPSQLTNAGIKDMTPGFRTYELWQRLKDNPSCAPFKRVVKESGPKPVWVQKNGKLEKSKSKFGACQFLTPEKGIKLSFIGGALLYRRQLESVENPRHFKQFKGPLEDYYTKAARYAYNRGLTSYLKVHKAVISQNSDIDNIEDFIDKLQKQDSDPNYNYIRKVDLDFITINKKIRKEPLIRKFYSEVRKHSSKKLSDKQISEYEDYLARMNKSQDDRDSTLKKHTIDYGLPPEQLDNLSNIAKELHDLEDEIDNIDPNTPYSDKFVCNPQEFG